MRKLALGTLAVDVLLGAAHAIEGVVVDDAGTPVEDTHVAVQVRQPGSRLGSSRGDYIDANARTDADGRFRVGDLPDGTVILRFYRRGYLQLELPDVEVDRTDVRVVVQRAAHLAGRVVDARTGVPIEEFTIRIVAGGGRYSAIWAREGKSFRNSDGLWDSRGEAAASGSVWGLEASAVGYAPTRNMEVVAAREPDPDACVFRLGRGATVAGRVVDAADGLGVEGATVTWFIDDHQLAAARHEPWGLLRTRTNKDGRFEMEHVPAGVARLAIETEGKPLHVDGPFELVDGGQIERVILLGGGGRIRGAVVDAAGLPGSNARLRLSQRAGLQESRDIEARADGTFEVRGLPAGDYGLSGYSMRGSVCTPYARTLTLGVDQDLELELAPLGTATVRGSVSADPPLGIDVPVILMPIGDGVGGRSSFRGRIVDGRFDLRGLPAGEFRVVVVVPLCDDTGARSFPHEPDVVRTDRHGRVRILVPPQADLFVHTTTADGAAWRVVSAGETSAGLSIDPAHVARFRVFDDEGEPVAGCSVSLVAPDSPLREDGDDRRVHPRIRDLCMVHAFPRKSGRTDADGYVTLVMPAVDVSLDLSIRHRERGLEGRVSVPFLRDREEGPIELTVGRRN